MFALFEEAGKFLTGRVLSEAESSLQVELDSGKRVKVKAANTLLKNKESMTNLRGKIHDYHGIRTLVTYHPAALLRNPEWKKYTWDDVKLLRNLYDAS